MARSKLLQDNLFLNKFYCNMFKDKGKNFESLVDFRSLINENESFDMNYFNFFIADERLRKKIKTYNENIQEYLDKINSKREIQVELKYFQYLAILFTEIHLDRYFEDPKEFRNEIEEFMFKNYPDEEISFDDLNLRKIAIWSATGSGKTLLMHINYLQVCRYLNEHNQLDEVENFYLITPNEGMSRQHKDELTESSLESEYLNPAAFSQGSLSKWADQKTNIKILDNHKIIKASEVGEKTKSSKNNGKSVDVEALGKNNIILVDEGHKGNKTIGSVWKDNRNRLFEDFGFMFEYSATFAESIGKGNDGTFSEYSKSIIFDYRYKYFHGDGYGKDYSILNLSKETEDNLQEYLTGALLSFYEQKTLFDKDPLVKQDFKLEDPLMVFVGAKVKGDKSDIANAIEFFVNFVNEEDIYIKYIEKILTGNSDIKNQETGKSIYDNRLIHLRNKNPESIYNNILKRLFYAGDQKVLGLFELSADGEIGLKFKDKWFGVINVGDTKEVLKEVVSRCGDKVNIEKSVRSSLFEEVDTEKSVNFILGSKKFIEGWNCFRVSSMGIMNMGKSEGAQIIQMFGRGVRLRGYNNSLKRTNKLIGLPQLPKGIEEIETLKIFGLSAKYMETFNKMLDQEGLNKKDIKIKIEIKKNFPDKEKLYVPTLSKKDETFFDEIVEITLSPPEDTQEIHLETLAKVIESRDKSLNLVDNELSTNEIKQELLDLLDFQKIILKLKDFCKRKGFSNIFLSFEEIKKIFLDIDYVAYGGKELLNLREGDLYKKIPKIENYVIKVLEKQLIHQITQERKSWERDNFTYEPISKHDKRLLDNEDYIFEIDSDLGKDIIGQIEDIKEEVESWKGNNIFLGNEKLKFIFLSDHLFYPLVYLKDNKEVVKVTPTPLVDSEKDFLKRFIDYIEANKEDVPFEKMYLLRNMPKIGTGFSLKEGRFYPDFILWGFKGNKQYISFIDPKGIARMSAESEKIKFYEEIKQLEKKLNKNNMILNSFIVTPTKFIQIKDSFGVNSKRELNKMNVLFLEDDFVGEMFEKIIQL